MKKIRLIIGTLCICCLSAQAQVRIVNSANNTAISDSPAFIDASSNRDINNSTNVGKGLIFPRVDLTAMTEFPGVAAGSSTSFPTRFDGMLVYNTAETGVAGVGNTEGTLSPGFWYYENKTASNDGGTWKRLGSGSGSGGGGSCANAPAAPGAMTLSKTTVEKNTTFTASVDAVGGATEYVWTLPPGLTTGTSNTNSIEITGAATGTYLAGSIKVAAYNECGQSATSNSPTNVVVSVTYGSDTIVVGDTKYGVYCYPRHAGCWMTTNSKSGNPTQMVYQGKTPGERGYYYSASDAVTACPPDFHLPSQSEVSALQYYVWSAEATPIEKAPWDASVAANMAGGAEGLGYYVWREWGASGQWHLANSTTLFLTLWPGGFELTGTNFSLLSVRCVKTN